MQLHEVTTSPRAFPVSHDLGKAQPAPPIRILICHSTISGYAAACWRELDAQEGISLSIIALAPCIFGESMFSDETVSGLNCLVLRDSGREHCATVRNYIFSQQPDVIFVSGWNIMAYKWIFSDKTLKEIPVILMLDNPLRADLRQFIGRYVLRPVLRRVRFVFVPGERAWQCGLFLRVPIAKLRRGLYGVDYKGLSPLHALRTRVGGGWPRSFLFVGQYHRRKGVDTLLEGYRRYRSTRNDPWPLRTAGMGPLGESFASVPGVVNLGFVQPDGMRKVWQEAGVLVLASRYDAWPLVIAEACAAGLPVLCTEACGSSVELVRHFFNGFLVPESNPDQVAYGLGWFHQHADQLATFGGRSLALAAAYSAQSWVERVVDISILAVRTEH